MQQGDNNSILRCANAVFPQDTIISLLLCTIFTFDTSKSDRILTATYTNDKAILCRDKILVQVCGKIQDNLTDLKQSLRKW